jgi:hypothetical protein
LLHFGVPIAGDLALALAVVVVAVLLGAALTLRARRA